eukprot:5929658-Amphidinium_carterae.1
MLIAVLRFAYKYGCVPGTFRKVEYAACRKSCWLCCVRGPTNTCVQLDTVCLYHISRHQNKYCGSC